MKKRLLRVPFRSVAGLTLDSPGVSGDRTLQYRIVLRQFWSRVKDNREPRLSLLKEYAKKKIAPSPISLDEMRQNFKAEGRRFLGCFACGSRGVDTVRHHIIQLQYGGPNTTHNVVNVCDACHAAIHPWL